MASGFSSSISINEVPTSHRANRRILSCSSTSGNHQFHTPAHIIIYIAHIVRSSPNVTYLPVALSLLAEDFNPHKRLHVVPFSLSFLPLPFFESTNKQRPFKMCWHGAPQPDINALTMRTCCTSTRNRRSPGSFPGKVPQRNEGPK